MKSIRAKLGKSAHITDVIQVGFDSKKEPHTRFRSVQNLSDGPNADGHTLGRPPSPLVLWIIQIP